MSDTDVTEVPGWASTVFWVLVIVFNIAVFFTAVGVLVLYFENDQTLGGIMLGIGVISWVIGIGGYGLTRRRLTR